MPSRPVIVWPQGGPLNPQIVSISPLPQAVVPGVYNFQLNAVGGKPPYNWTTTSFTPNTGGQFTLSPTGLLSGTLLTAEVESLTVKVTDSIGNSGTKAFVLYALNGFSITNPGMPDGTVGTPYSLQMTASGGFGPALGGSYNWAIVGGKPSWMTITPGGLVGGTPTAVESDNITFSVTDGLGQVTFSTYPLNINAASSLIPVSNFTPSSSRFVLASVDGNAIQGQSLTLTDSTGALGNKNPALPVWYFDYAQGSLVPNPTYSAATGGSLQYFFQGPTFINSGSMLPPNALGAALTDMTNGSNVAMPHVQHYDNAHVTTGGGTWLYRCTTKIFNWQPGLATGNNTNLKETRMWAGFPVAGGLQNNAWGGTMGPGGVGGGLSFASTIAGNHQSFGGHVPQANALTVRETQLQNSSANDVTDGHYQFIVDGNFCAAPNFLYVTSSTGSGSANPGMMTMSVGDQISNNAEPAGSQLSTTWDYADTTLQRVMWSSEPLWQTPSAGIAPQPSALRTINICTQWQTTGSVSTIRFVNQFGANSSLAGQKLYVTDTSGNAVLVGSFPAAVQPNRTVNPSQAAGPWTPPGQTNTAINYLTPQAAANAQVAGDWIDIYGPGSSVSSPFTYDPAANAPTLNFKGKANGTSTNPIKWTRHQGQYIRFTSTQLRSIPTAYGSAGTDPVTGIAWQATTNVNCEQGLVHFEGNSYILMDMRDDAGTGQALELGNPAEWVPSTTTPWGLSYSHHQTLTVVSSSNCTMRGVNLHGASSYLASYGGWDCNNWWFDTCAGGKHGVNDNGGPGAGGYGDGFSWHGNYTLFTNCVNALSGHGQFFADWGHHNVYQNCDFSGDWTTYQATTGAPSTYASTNYAGSLSQALPTIASPFSGVMRCGPSLKENCRFAKAGQGDLPTGTPLVEHFGWNPIYRFNIGVDQTAGGKGFIAATIAQSGNSQALPICQDYRIYNNSLQGFSGFFDGQDSGMTGLCQPGLYSGNYIFDNVGAGLQTPTQFLIRNLQTGTECGTGGVSPFNKGCKVKNNVLDAPTATTNGASQVISRTFEYGANNGIAKVSFSDFTDSPGPSGGTAGAATVFPGDMGTNVFNAAVAFTNVANREAALTTALNGMTLATGNSVGLGDAIPKATVTVTATNAAQVQMSDALWLSDGFGAGNGAPGCPGVAGDYFAIKHAGVFTIYQMDPYVDASSDAARQSGLVNIIGTGSWTAGDTVYPVLRDGKTVVVNRGVNLPLVFDKFISPTGNDANAGTLAAPWAITSLQKGNANNVGGRRYGILPGTYNVSTFPGTNNSNCSLTTLAGTPSSPTIVAGCDAGGNYVGSTGSRLATIIDDPAATGFVLTRGTIGSDNFNDGTQPIPHDIQILGLKITANGNSAGPNGFSGVIFGAGGTPQTGIVVADCDISGYIASSGNGNFACVFDSVGMKGTIIRNCKLYNCYQTNLAKTTHGNGSCVHSYSQDTQVINCDLSSAHNAIYQKNAGGPPQGLTATGNYIHPGLGMGVMFAGFNNATGVTPPAGGYRRFQIDHNVVEGTADTDYFGANSGPDGTESPIVEYNNTFYSTGALGIGRWPVASAAVTAGAKTSTYNNILVRGSVYQSGDVLLGPTLSNVQVCDFNCWPTTPQMVLSATSNGTLMSYATWKAQAGSPDAHSLTGSPGFVGAIVADGGAAQYQLGAGSQCLNAGRVGGVVGGTQVNMGAWDGTMNIGATI